jgi:hypothetical protein
MKNKLLNSLYVKTICLPAETRAGGMFDSSYFDNHLNYVQQYDNRSLYYSGLVPVRSHDF